jgi:beta-phosphoglucomutase
MLRAVIFDFDGVIADSEILHLRAFNQTLSAYGIEISKEDYYNDYLGLTDRDLLETLNEQGRLNLSQRLFEKLLKKKKHIFQILAKTDCFIIDGVREFLQMLKDNNIQMAICSGALLSEIELILIANKLREFFDVIVSAEQIKRGKPFPDGFNLTLKKLNQKLTTKIKPSECIVIEDSHWGLDAAKAAGMKTIAVTTSYDADQLSSADKISDNLANLIITDLQKLCE